MSAPPRQSSRNSIQVFLNPDQDTIENLNFGLSQLRGANNKLEQQQQVPDHAFQVATLLLSHARPDYIREGVQIMEGLTFRAFEEYRHLLMMTNNVNTTTTTTAAVSTGTAVSTSAAIVGTVVQSNNNNNSVVDNKQLEEQYQREKLLSSNNNKNSNNDNKNNKNSSSIERDRQRAKEMLVSGYFLLAVGQYKLGSPTSARNCAERVLELQPHHPQASALRDLIDEELMRNAAIGVGVLAVGVMGAAALLKGLFGK